MIDAGTHRAHATHSQLGYTSKGTEQIGIRFKFESGHMLTWYGYFSDKAVDFTLKALRSCGWTGTNIGELDGDEGQILCNEVDLVVEHEPDYEDPTLMRPRIRWVNSVGNPQLKLKAPMDQGQRAAFAKRLMGTVLAEQKANPQQSPAPQQQRRQQDASQQQQQQQSNRSDEDLPPEAYGADDDIPF